MAHFARTISVRLDKPNLAGQHQEWVESEHPEQPTHRASVRSGWKQTLAFAALGAGRQLFLGLHESIVCGRHNLPI